jgi:hypothetical protein
MDGRVLSSVLMASNPANAADADIWEKCQCLIAGR